MGTKIMLTDEAKVELKRYATKWLGTPQSKKMTYSQLVISMANELDSQGDALESSNSAWRQSIKEQSERLVSELDTAKSQMATSAKVNKHLLDLFILSVGGVPPEGN
tara:strand:+ start:2035 stop:2355 length:321 start_codon:yes stop_codon:yes gene_type:complete